MNANINLALITATEYAEMRNLEKCRTGARAEAEGYQFGCGMLSENPGWWADTGCKTGEDVRRMFAIAAFSDTFKEINNFRPRYDYSLMSTDEIETETTLMMEREEDRQQAERDRKREEKERKEQRWAEATDTTPLTHNPFAALLGA